MIRRFTTRVRQLRLLANWATYLHHNGLRLPRG